MELTLDYIKEHVNELALVDNDYKYWSWQNNRWKSRKPKKMPPTIYIANPHLHEKGVVTGLKVVEGWFILCNERLHLNSEDVYNWCSVNSGWILSKILEEYGTYNMSDIRLFTDKGEAESYINQWVETNINKIRETRVNTTKKKLATFEKAVKFLNEKLNQAESIESDKLIQTLLKAGNDEWSFCKAIDIVYYDD